MQRTRLTIGVLALVALAAAGCSSDDDGGGVAATTTAGTAAPPTTTAMTGADADPPAIVPDRAAGAFGFSHYVFSDYDGEIVPTLVEGPRGQQVRCQDEALTCSYLELQALAESGDEVPEELQMSREELVELVAQLDETAAWLAQFPTLDDACAGGYQVTSLQNPNMGIHMVNDALVADGVFDPGRPEMLLFAKEDGLELDKDALGSCEGDTWVGAEGFEPVGTAFMVLTQSIGDDHPEGFAGPIDNWHVHYNTCRGLTADSVLPPDRCEAAGGQFIEKVGWMMHAYVSPDHDSQSGVFAMWNTSVWPVADLEAIRASANANPGLVAVGASTAVIEDFAFEDARIAPGATLAWVNVDGAPHTVTAGRPGEATGDFDSGTLAPGEVFEVTLEAPGTYPIFCAIHPSMTGAIEVG